MTKIVVIGAGPSGRVAAMEAAQKGYDVTLIEKSHIGGKCLNQTCMVTTALTDITKHLLDAENFFELGITDTEPSIEYNKITSLIKETQKKIRHIIKKETISTSVEYVQGLAEIDAENKIVIVNEDDEYYYDKLLVCTGSSPLIPDIPGIENAFTYKDILKLKEIPEKLVIIGGGSSSAEYAGIFSSFGSEVDILCRSRFLKILNDPSTEDYIVRNLLKNTIVHENVEIKEITDTSVITNFGEIEGKVLLATGIKANSKILEGIVELDEQGNVLVDKNMQTSNPDIYAAGDIIGGICTTPIAHMEGKVAIENILGNNIQADYSIIPMTISLPYDVSYLTGTEVSNYGQTLKQVVSVGPGNFWHALESKTGIIKENVNPNNGKINYVLSIAPSSSIAMPYIAKAIKDDLKVQDFENFLEIHPTTDGISKLMEYFKNNN